MVWPTIKPEPNCFALLMDSIVSNVLQVTQAIIAGFSRCAAAYGQSGEVEMAVKCREVTATTIV
jgi:hypothetical protein